MKTAIVDHSIVEPGTIRAMITLPHEETDYDTSDKLQCGFANAMHYLTIGETEKGKALLEENYAMGYLRAGQVLAYGYSVGWFGERDYSSSVTILRQLVNKNDSSAMNDYAYAYQHGLGVKKSRRWAKYWFERAAELGNANALSNIAHDYIFGEKASRNYDKGFSYAQLAANDDQEMAMNALGTCYEKGLGTAKDERLAFKWYELAVKNGAGACAEYNLARCYRKGIGVRIDEKKAKKLEALAIKHGYKQKESIL